MQTVTVRTTQNVSIEYPLASLGDRILAYFLDALIIIAYYIFMAIILGLSDLFSISIFIGLLVIPAFLYHLMFEIFMNGQTPGKRQMNIQVVRMDGTPATVGNYIIRWLIRLFEIDLFSGALAMVVIAINGKGQRLGDIAAGTTVIKLVGQREVTSKEIFAVPDNNYVATYPQVVQLNDRDIELIQQALEVNRATGNNQPVMAVTEKIKTMLGIQTELPPIKFLYTIVKDYGHITSGR